MEMKRKERGKEKKQRGDYLPFPWSLNLNKESILGYLGEIL